jgi:hypothetical protein
MLSSENLSASQWVLNSYENFQQLLRRKGLKDGQIMKRLEEVAKEARQELQQGSEAVHGGANQD